MLFVNQITYNSIRYSSTLRKLLVHITTLPSIPIYLNLNCTLLIVADGVNRPVEVNVGSPTPDVIKRVQSFGTRNRLVFVEHLDRKPFFAFLYVSLC